MSTNLPTCDSPAEFHSQLFQWFTYVGMFIRHPDLRSDEAEEFERQAISAIESVASSYDQLCRQSYTALQLFRKGRLRVKASAESCVFQGPDGCPYASYHDMAYEWLGHLVHLFGGLGLPRSDFDWIQWSKLYDGEIDWCVAQLQAEAAAVLKVETIASVRKKPKWDADTGELKFGTEIARKVGGNAASIREVLTAFEELDWPERIDDPRRGGKDAARLNDTVKSLNKNLRHMRFAADGSGAGYRWEQVSETMKEFMKILETF